MRHPSLLALVTVLGIAASSFAGQAAAAKPASSAAKPNSAWASGQLLRIDAAARTFVVKQGTHEMTFSLAPDAKVTQGKETLSLDKLSGDAGHTVKVEYHVDGATKRATLVEVGPAAKPAPAPKPAAKPSK